MERRNITVRPPENLPELVAAAGRLKRHGFLVDLECGVVSYPNREVALNGRLTDDMVADAQAIAGLTWIPSGAA